MTDGGTGRQTCGRLWQFWTETNGRKNGKRQAEPLLRWRSKSSRHQRTFVRLYRPSSEEGVAGVKIDDGHKNEKDNKYNCKASMKHQLHKNGIKKGENALQISVRQMAQPCGARFLYAV